MVAVTYPSQTNIDTRRTGPSRPYAQISENRNQGKVGRRLWDDKELLMGPGGIERLWWPNSNIVVVKQKVVINEKSVN